MKEFWTHEGNAKHVRVDYATINGVYLMKMEKS